VLLLLTIKKRRGDMVIPTQFLPINTNRPKPVKRGEVTLEKSDSNSDGTKQVVRAVVSQYDKREGEDRRKRKVKPLLDTRTGRDRRLENNKNSVDIKA
jgi:hypothetical protein